MSSKKKFKISEYNDVVDFREYEDLPKRALILAKCYDCCCYSRLEAKKCVCYTCPLWKVKDYYFNKNKRSNRVDLEK